MKKVLDDFEDFGQNTSTMKNKTEEIQYLAQILTTTTIQDVGRIVSINKRISEILGEND